MKFIARFLTFTFLHVALGIFMLVSAVTFVSTDRDVIKSSISEAGVYDSIIPALIDNFSQEESEPKDPLEQSAVEGPAEDEEESLSFDDPEIRKIFEDSITPEILQTEFEGLLNDIYMWLEGEQAELDFEINLAQVRTNLTENITSYITTRLDSLPECTSLEQAQANQDDVFNIECRPPGFTSAEAEDKIQQGVSEFELFEDPKITPETIDANSEDGETIEQRLDPVKNVYSSLSPGFYMVSAVLFAAIVVFMLARMPIGHAATSLGKNLFAVGLFSGIVAFIAKLVLPGRIQALSEGEGELAVIGSSFAEVYADKNLTFIIMFAVVIGAIGLVFMLPHHLKKLTSGARKHKK